ncbi:diguanylate cyclase [Oceanicoccus sagamiensis]|uniref:diguanylate cyclase n=1 Tax=Oceanicoccus sagamiensis TaxID=716816 RepID=A0A1X9NBZ1_9GAMM|nr:diguanylate cyclase [Oceanicoccus sagamiensis]ARN75116.1 diguanylate cyclase response regulator [Oceanicoccus sagamiensis]
MEYRKPEILIVDDSPANIHVLAQLLSAEYQVKVASDGARCLELALAGPAPDLILLDVNMPEINGYEVCKQLKANEATKTIPIIFITGMTSAENEAYGFELGAVDYISKPFHPAVVEARVKTQITIKQQADKLERMAMRDQLTGLYNRYYLIDIASKKIASAVNHQSPLSIAVIDIDKFKSFNDQYGHEFGDEVLVEFAQLLESHCCANDVVSRYGGEEFVMLMEGSDLALSLEKSESLRRIASELKPKGISVTASFGVTTLRPQDDCFDDMFSRADAALFAAKTAGRNCVRQHQ